MPSGIYHRINIEDRLNEYLAETRNLLKVKKFDPESINYILGIFERMPLNKIRKEIRLLINDETEAI